MFIRSTVHTIIVVVANVRKTVYMQECMNYTIAMIPLSYTIYRFTCNHHALTYIIITLARI